MTALQRRLFSVMLGAVLALLIGQLLNLNGNVQAHTTSLYSRNTQNIPTISFSYYFYGSNHSWMYTATNDWYQHQGNWCGIANVRAIQVYDWLYYNGKSPQWDNSQEAIHNRLNSITSPWGAGGGYVKTNISRDFGTDPHAIAFAAWYDT